MGRFPAVGGDDRTGARSEFGPIPINDRSALISADGNRDGTETRPVLDLTACRGPLDNGSG